MTQKRTLADYTRRFDVYSQLPGIKDEATRYLGLAIAFPDKGSNYAKNPIMATLSLALRLTLNTPFFDPLAKLITSYNVRTGRDAILYRDESGKYAAHIAYHLHNEQDEQGNPYQELHIFQTYRPEELAHQGVATQLLVDLMRRSHARGVMRIRCGAGDNMGMNGVLNRTAESLADELNVFVEEEYRGPSAKRRERKEKGWVLLLRNTP